MHRVSYWIQRKMEEYAGRTNKKNTQRMLYKKINKLGMVDNMDMEDMDTSKHIYMDRLTY